MITIKIKTDSEVLMDWLSGFISSTTQSDNQNEINYCEILEQKEDSISVKATDRVILSIMRKNLPMTVQVLPQD
jgi:hypothetical protein